jgi:hypothetical protein
MRHWVVWGVVSLSAVGGGMRPAEAQPYMGTINVTNLPAPCTPTANTGDPEVNSTAIQCAIDNLMPNGGELYFPAGRYALKRSINVTNKHISIRGAGQRNTNLVWTEGNSHGINFVSNTGSVNHTLNVQSLSVLRGGGTGGDGITGGNGINAVWQTPSAYDTRGGTSATLFDIHVSFDWPTSTSDWKNCVVLTNALNARINTFNMQMERGEEGGSNRTDTSIKIAGASKGVVISDGNMGRAANGVWVTDTSENVRIENVETSENNTGFIMTSTGGNNMISNCHAGVVYWGITVGWGADAVIIDNLLYPWVWGIYVHNAPRAQIRGNQISHPIIAPPIGIWLDGTMSNAVLVGNQTNCSPSGSGILLGGGVSDSLVVANDHFSFNSCLLIDHGTNNVKGINKP